LRGCLSVLAVAVTASGLELRGTLEVGALLR